MKNLWRWELVTNSLLNTAYFHQLASYDRLVIGYSGGLDSTVLLHLLSTQPQLHSKIVAVHINHGLSTNAPSWQLHCQKICQQLDIPLMAQQIDFNKEANIEDAARHARYAVFKTLIGKNECLILAHHLNDQAETLLLHLMRGAGVNGLAAMVPAKPFAQGELLRPLLHYSRRELEVYAHDHGLQWIDDESNENIDFSRNFLRHDIIPLLASRWPKVVNNLARSSEHCQQALANLEDLALIDCPSLANNSPYLTIDSLMVLNRARLTNVLRLWFKKNGVKLPSTLTLNCIITEVIQAREDTSPQVSWQDNCVRRYQKTLYLLKNSLPEIEKTLVWDSFPEPLDLPLGLGSLHATLGEQGLFIPANSVIEIGFRQGGESFRWHGQNKELKKLFQEWRIPPWLRQHVPLVYINQQLACVVGYAISDLFYSSLPNEVFQISLV